MSINIKKFGINKIEGDLKIIEITPVSLSGEAWYLVGFEHADRDMGDMFHLAFVYSKDFEKNPKDLLQLLQNFFVNCHPMVRVHSECILGDSFSSDLCDCGLQLRQAMDDIVKNGCGILLYLRQEGRGIGLRAKLSALSIQEGYLKGKKRLKKHTPDEANQALGYEIDERRYRVVPIILKFLGACDIFLMTGNPDKKKIVKNNGIKTKCLSGLSYADTKINKRQQLELDEKMSRNYFYELDL